MLQYLTRALRISTTPHYSVLFIWLHAAKVFSQVLSSRFVLFTSKTGNSAD